MALSFIVALFSAIPASARLHLDPHQNGANPSTWDIVEPYTAGGQTFLFFLKSHNGRGEIRRTDNGKVGERVGKEFNWTTGWTIAEFFTVSGKTFLLLYKETNGDVSIHQIKDNGEIGNEVLRDKWPKDWDVMSIYVSGADTYLYRLAKKNPFKTRADVTKIYWTDEAAVAPSSPPAQPHSLVTGQVRSPQQERTESAAATNGCYWLNARTNAWQPMPRYSTKKQCFEMDSCNGGLGRSGGGCYKWAASPDASGQPWD